MASNLLNRISANQEICHGKACIKGTRIMVSIILDCLAEGMEKNEILNEYHGLTLEDIHAAIAYGAALSRAEIIPLQ
jgi:uncharacterized protein (DUF433 family)